MNRLPVGKVTEEEKNEVMYVYDRMMGLKELLLILEPDENSEEESKKIYNNAIRDLGESKRIHQEWWNKMSTKYAWKGKGKEGASWNIDFDDNTIYLVDVES